MAASTTFRSKNDQESSARHDGFPERERAAWRAGLPPMMLGPRSTIIQHMLQESMSESATEFGDWGDLRFPLPRKPNARRVGSHGVFRIPLKKSG